MINGEWKDVIPLNYPKHLTNSSDPLSLDLYESLADCNSLLMYLALMNSWTLLVSPVLNASIACLTTYLIPCIDILSSSAVYASKIKELIGCGVTRTIISRYNENIRSQGAPCGMKGLLPDLCCTIEKLYFVISTYLSVNLGLQIILRRVNHLLHLLYTLWTLEDDLRMRGDTITNSMEEDEKVDIQIDRLGR